MCWPRCGAAAAAALVLDPAVLPLRAVQKGRKREHYQWNMDIIGLGSVAGEAELMAAQVEFLTLAGLNCAHGHSDVVIKVSNRQVIQHFLEGWASAPTASPPSAW